MILSIEVINMKIEAEKNFGKVGSGRSYAPGHINETPVHPLQNTADLLGITLEKAIEISLRTIRDGLPVQVENKDGEITIIKPLSQETADALPSFPSSDVVRGDPDIEGLLYPESL